MAKKVNDPMKFAKQTVAEYQSAQSVYTIACAEFDKLRTRMIELRNARDVARSQAMAACNAAGLTWRPTQMFRE